MKTIETSRGSITLRDIKLKDNRQARSFAQRTGIFNEQDYYTKLIYLLADKDEKFLEELSGQDDNKLVETVREMIFNAKIGDDKKQ
jgi:hypothetical protein